MSRTTPKWPPSFKTAFNSDTEKIHVHLFSYWKVSSAVSFTNVIRESVRKGGVCAINLREGFTKKRGGSMVFYHLPLEIVKFVPPGGKIRTLCGSPGTPTE